jgi:hypothetical protein
MYIALRCFETGPKYVTTYIVFKSDALTVFIATSTVDGVQGFPPLERYWNYVLVC